MKTYAIGILFALLVGLVFIKPVFVAQLYGSVLGRVVLISCILMFAMNNLTLGALALCAIVFAISHCSLQVRNSYLLQEGFEQQPTTIGDDNIDAGKGTQKVLSKKLSELKENIGVNKEDIKNAIMSKSSKSIPVDASMTSSDEVDAASSEMLNSKEAFGQFSTPTNM